MIDLHGPEEHIYALETKKILRRVLKKLPNRTVCMLFLRFGFDGEKPKTLKEVGTIFKLSSGRVHWLEREALSRLRYEIVREATTLDRIMGMP